MLMCIQMLLGSISWREFGTARYVRRGDTKSVSEAKCFGQVLGKFILFYYTKTFSQLLFVTFNKVSERYKP